MSASQLQEDLARVRRVLREAPDADGRERWAVATSPRPSAHLDADAFAALRRVIAAFDARTIALQWYADPENNGPQEFTEITGSYSVSVAKWRAINDDEGDVARTALQEVPRG